MRQVRMQTVLNVGVTENTDGAAKLLEDQPDVEKVEPRGKILVVTLRAGVDDYSPLATLLVQQGYKLSLFKEDEINLETAFMALTKGITA